MKINNLEALETILPDGVHVMDQVILNGRLGDPQALSFNLRADHWAIKLANMTLLEVGGDLTSRPLIFEYANSPSQKWRLYLGGWNQGHWTWTP